MRNHVTTVFIACILVLSGLSACTKSTGPSLASELAKANCPFKIAPAGNTINIGIDGKMPIATGKLRASVSAESFDAWFQTPQGVIIGACYHMSVSSAANGEVEILVPSIVSRAEGERLIGALRATSMFESIHMVEQ